MMEVESDTIVIGVGNEYRRDDAAGVAVARRLRSLCASGATILEMSGEGAALMEAWKSAPLVIVIDAARSGAVPGTIHRLNASTPVPSGFFSYSTHEFSVAEAVEMARVLGQLPPRLIIYGIEGEDFSPGVGLTASVEKAVAWVAAQVAGQLQRTGSPGVKPISA